MRPASPLEECFYCGEPIGEFHKSECVLINKKVKIKMIVEYEIAVPNDWDQEEIEFHRNEGTWCSDNALDELEEIAREDGCLCQKTTFEFVEVTSDPYLDEK